MLARALLAASFLLGAVNAIPTISAVGSKFFDSNGKQFFVKGVAYQLTGNDPLVDTAQCTRDAALMKTLGANAIRVYHVDSSANHDGCMQVFANNGIYLFVDLDTFSTWLTPENTQWTDTQYNAFAAVMDAFHSYDNTLGYFIGNEVEDSAGQSLASPYIKAATRDMKAYGKSKGYRNIPVGYSAADIPSLRPVLQNYLVCGGNPSDSIDFFGLNAYEWCGTNTYTGSGYSNLNAMAQGYPVPIFFSETGCMTIKPRTFGDQSAILGPDMDGTWSGAIIYEWIEEVNDYGLISYGPQTDPSIYSGNVEQGFTRSGTPTPVLPDFTNLQSVWATLTPTGVALSNYKTNEGITTPACPTSTAGGWMVNGNVALPNRVKGSGSLIPMSATSELVTATATTFSELTSVLATDTWSPTKSVATQTTTAASEIVSPTKKASAGHRTAIPGAASEGQEVVKMGLGLLAVFMGAVWWL